MLIFSILTGVICGFAAITIKWLIHFVETTLVSWIPIEKGSILLFAYPMVGILLTILFVRYYVKIISGMALPRCSTPYRGETRK